MVRSSIPHKAIERPVHYGEGVETQAIKLYLNVTELTIYNVYSSARSDLDLTEILSLAEEESVIVGGDFNAHHILSSRSETNRAGRHLATLLEGLVGVKLLNNGEPTHIQGNILDLTLFSSYCLGGRGDLDGPPHTNK